MISATEFIWVYNELFRYLERRDGKEEVVKFWRKVSDSFLQDLRQQIVDEGLKGMYRFWSRTLSEEGGRHHISLYDDMFVIDIHKCPSVSKIREGGRVTPYSDYCEHCYWLYVPLIESLGYKVDYRVLDAEKGQCRMTVYADPEGRTRKGKPPER